MRILVFGDSITFGYWDREGGWVHRLKIFTDSRSLASDDYDVSIYNLGISGDTTEELLARFDAETRARSIDQEVGIIFAIGINDSYYFDKEQTLKVSEPNFRKNIKELIYRAKQYTSNIFFVGLNPVDEKKVNPMPWNPDISYHNNQIELYNRVIQDICKANTIEFIDVMMEFRKTDFKTLLEDGAHPNSEGHLLIFETVKKNLSSKGII